LATIDHQSGYLGLMPESDDLQTPWIREGAALIGEWKFEDFAEALAFVNKVGEAAEAADHHPDITIKWNRVRLTLSTHSAGTVTKKDFALAKEISAL
jgi:4a-hydroxytetrahydrobiopterin dehydratase